MAVLNASSSPTTTLTTSQNTKPTLSLLSPAVSNSLYLAAVIQQLLSTTTIFLLFRTYLLSLFLFQQSYHASQVLLIRSLNASFLLCKKASWVSKQGMRVLRKKTEGIRQRLFREFMIFILGGGNQLFLVLFWPGWILVGGSVWAAWRLWG
jgi:hypothetical protein